ncbi:MAG: hypothetical protein V7459_13580 [Oceanicoccus sp.]
MSINETPIPASPPHLSKLLKMVCLSAGLIMTFSTQSQADQAIVFQDCLLEGKVVADKSSDGDNIVRIDFYKAQPFTSESRCIIDGSLEFKQPKGSLIENLSTGSVVQYHYIRMSDGATTWQLVGAFI